MNHFAAWQKLTQHCKPTILTLKKKIKNESERPVRKLLNHRSEIRVSCSRVETERKWMHSKDMLRGELISCGYRLNIEMRGNKEKSKDCQGYFQSFPETSLSLLYG